MLAEIDVEIQKQAHNVLLKENLDLGKAIEAGRKVNYSKYED